MHGCMEKGCMGEGKWVGVLKDVTGNDELMD